MHQTLYGLLGHPLGHSFSAQYFAAKFQREHINAEYLNFDLAEASLVRQLFTDHPNLRGINVTIPHKQAVMPLLDKLSDDARAIGAVNVIKAMRTNGKLWLCGYNSDFVGFLQSLQPLLQSHHHSALVLGTGGASRAVAYALKQLGIETHFVSRSRGAYNNILYSELTPHTLAAHLLIVNTTPLGMFPNTDNCPPIPYECLTPQHLLYDLVYNPEQTLFMKKGLEAGSTVKNGLEMLHLQAEEAWRIWNEP